MLRTSKKAATTSSSSWARVTHTHTRGVMLIIEKRTSFELWQTKMLSSHAKLGYAIQRVYWWLLWHSLGSKRSRHSERKPDLWLLCFWGFYSSSAVGTCNKAPSLCTLPVNINWNPLPLCVFVCLAKISLSQESSKVTKQIIILLLFKWSFQHLIPLPGDQQVILLRRWLLVWVGIP